MRRVPRSDGTASGCCRRWQPPATAGHVNVLTHCNAGWLACVDWGTALAPVYAAHEAGIPVHVYVDETRPRSQGAFLTAFELGAHGVPYTVIADNAGGHLMQQGEVDVCIVGSDRTTAAGDVANKIGTYLKALAAHDNGVPFYAALPFSTIDWTLDDGVRQVPIEERSPREVTHVRGRTHGAASRRWRSPRPAARAQPRFDVTPARLVTGIITERGVTGASREGLAALYVRPRPGTEVTGMSDHREEIIAVTHALDAAGMVPNKSGNVSCRVTGGFAITPAGIPYRELLPTHIVTLPLDAPVPATEPRPSSEWRMHAAIYRARPDVTAIVHTHSPHATALAAAGRGIPPFHYMIALAGGDVRCMPYATFGTAELAESAVRGLEGRRACLLGNHGVMAIGNTLARAHAVAVEVENLAGEYLAMLSAGLVPQLLDDAEIQKVVAKFTDYGRLG